MRRRHKNRRSRIRAAAVALFVVPLLDLGWWYLNRTKGFVPMDLRPSSTGDRASTYPWISPSSFVGRG